MSADAMFNHRYGFSGRASRRPGFHDVGDEVVLEMFGAEDDEDLEEDIEDADFSDFESSPEYQEWASQFDGPAVPLTTTDKAEGLVAIASNIFMAQVRQYIPQVHSYDVRGGKDASGSKYAKVTLETSDPNGVLQKAAMYALQTAGAQGVSVTTQPSAKPGQVVLIFSHGASAPTP